MIEGSINTYYYDVLIESKVTINFNLILDYIKEQLLTEEEINIPLIDICDYFDDNIEDILINTADCFDFVGSDNEYTLECISNDFRAYLEKCYGKNYEYKRL